MKKLYEEFRKNLSGSEIMDQIKTLSKIERGQTFSHYHKAVDYIVSLMKEYNIPNAEKLLFPADGRTAYEDKRMPIAWDATIGKITLCDEEGTVVADYTKNPFNLIKGSVGTKEGGEILRIITEDQILAGEDPEDALVLLNTATPPRPQALSAILDLGARGIIADFVTGRMNDVNAVQWVNACTEGSSWHIGEDDREFIGFSIDLVTGNLLREKAAKGILKAKVECDGKRYTGTLPAATALIPGKKKEEVWLLAHTFEPFIDDDASGVIAGIHIAKEILKRGTPEYSLRMIFAMELYGFAAFHATFKGKAIGGANLDTLPGGNHYSFKVVPPISSIPFHGLEFLQEFCDSFNTKIPCRYTNRECYDDMFLSERSCSIPTVWFLADKRGNTDDPVLKRRTGLWHNSIQCEEDFFQEDVMTDAAAMTGAWFAKTLFHKEAPKELEVPVLKEISSPWRDYAKEFVFERIYQGLPHDLAFLPKEKRFRVPDGALYGPFPSILSFMDGKKSVAQLILEAEADRNCVITEAQVAEYLNALNRLADFSYLKAVRRKEITVDEIVKALSELGVTSGDTLLVHSAPTKFGYIPDSAVTIIEALRKAAGNDGTLLFPAFTRPYIYLGSAINKNWNYRPYDAKDLSQITTGSLAKTLLAGYPDSVRSAHVTHSWAGIGAGAQACLAPHGETDGPCSKNSPPGEALRRNGKVLFFGCSLAPNTFLHYLETEAGVPYLQSAVCRVKDPDGTLKTVHIEDHLPGHRDFYTPDALNCKFYRQAVQNGLQIRSTALGMGTLHLMDLNELYSIGMDLIRKDKRILLCDDENCFFCKRY